MTQVFTEGLTITQMSVDAYHNSKSKGFHDGEFNIAEKLALIHSEVSEALEAHREGEMDTRYEHKNAPYNGVYKEPVREQLGGGTSRGKPVGFMSELADIIIRVGDLAGRLGRSDELERVIVEKMAYNKTRPHKHGKAY